MAKYLVETYYTCTFKVNHYLDDVNETELKNLEKRDDGKFEVLDVKLDNRKTKNLDPNNNKVIDKKIDLVPSNSESKKENFEQSVKDVLNQSEKSGQTCFQFRSAALLRTASQTRCVSCASRKFGCASSPAWRACKKSAT